MDYWLFQCHMTATSPVIHVMGAVCSATTSAGKYNLFSLAIYLIDKKN